MLKFCQLLLWVPIISTWFFSCSDPASPDTTPPEASIMDAVHYSDNSFTVSWSENTNSDFDRYSLFYSNFADMSNSTLIFESTNKQETSFTITDIEIADKHFFQLITFDDADLTSVSNIEEGVSHLFICNFENFSHINFIGYVFITDTSGQLLGNYYSWIESGVVVIENPNLSDIPEEIGISFALDHDDELSIETFLNIKTGSEWFIKNTIEILDFTPMNMTFNFENIPEHHGYLLSEELFYFFELQNPITSTYEIVSLMSPHLYLKLFISEGVDQFILIPYNGGVSFNVDLNNLQYTQTHILQNIPADIYHLTSLQRGYLNSGNYEESSYAINIGTLGNLSGGNLNLELPDGLFNDYYSFTACFHDNFNEISYHEVYGEIPSEFRTVNGEMELLESHNNSAIIQISGKFDVVKSEWAYGNGIWMVSSPPEIETIILPKLIEELNNLFSDVANFSSLELQNIHLEEYNGLESYNDYIGADFENNSHFWNLVNEKSTRQFSIYGSPTLTSEYYENRNKLSLRQR